MSVKYCCLDLTFSNLIMFLDMLTKPIINVELDVIRFLV